MSPHSHHDHHDHHHAVAHAGSGESHAHRPVSLVRLERTTRIVVLLSAATMAVELGVGWWTHSLALVADGWHMATHVGALGLAWLAYLFSRRLTEKSHLQFNQKKLFALAGYTNAIGLGLVGAFMLHEAWERFVAPEAIMFAEAIPVAVGGLIVNVVSARLLHNHHDDHHHDQNLRAAYIHIVADAVTSVLALAALVVGRVWGVLVLDPIFAAVGALVVLIWAVGLIKSAMRELLDAKPGHAEAKTTES